MPVKKSQAAWYLDWIKRINGDSIYMTDGRIIFCRACMQHVPSAKFFQLNQHNQTTKHRLNSERLANEGGVDQQNFMEQGTSSGSNELNMDLVGEQPIMDEYSKIFFLKAVFQHKDILFEPYTGRQSWEIKDKMWQQIFNECVNAGCRGLVDAEHLRKITWQNLQRRSKEKYDKSKKVPEGTVKFSKIDELVLDIIGRDSGKLNGTDFIVNHQPLFTGETTSTFDETLNMVAKEEAISNPPSPLNQIIPLELSMIGNKRKTQQKRIEFSDELEELKKRKMCAEIVKLEAEARLINAQAEMKELEVEEKKMQFYNRE
uniref:Uncharacterized protein n=1 Tax=Meloidogyne enterolobii TaxID=390850 RepID=A0A6V7UGL3_MELEN|nr:unnamed protein product [Meloidogyne enterolobii]